MSCEHCSDRKHVQTPQGWVPCVCLAAARLLQKFKSAGLSDSLAETTLYDLLADTPEKKEIKSVVKRIIAGIAEGQDPNIIFVSDTSTATLFVSLALKSALLSRTTGVFVRLDDLVTQFLTNDKRDFLRARDAEVLGIVFGDEYVQPIHKYVLEFIANYRKGEKFMTVWGSSVDVNSFTARYTPGDKDFWLKRLHWLSIPQNW